MNRALPPGDRGYRGADSGGAPGPARVVPGAGGLVGGTAAAAAEKGLKRAPFWPACTQFTETGPVARPCRHGRNVGHVSRNTLPLGAIHDANAASLRQIGSDFC